MCSLPRCEWSSLNIPLYREYHDKEWGVPVHDDVKLFEFLALEGFQAGLSWYIVLKRRENFRTAFDGFNPEVVSNYDSKKVWKLLSDPGIIRNGPKIKAIINNARQFLKVQREFGSFDKYIWGFTNYRTVHNSWRTVKEIPATSPISDKISKDLLSRGFRFVGSKICYAHMQATGMVNDHIVTCFRYSELKRTSV
jgi:DNA-3-methyladenine glycosylase I